MGVFDGLERTGTYLCPNCLTKLRYKHRDVFNLARPCSNCGLDGYFLICISKKNYRPIEELIKLQKDRFTFKEKGFKEFWNNRRPLFDKDFKNWKSWREK
jgi:hypothetical protein